jgi:hypothetical protein
MDFKIISCFIKDVSTEAKKNDVSYQTLNNKNQTNHHQRGQTIIL